jgi:YgiT-type zinc finger domain-containing protein
MEGKMWYTHVWQETMIEQKVTYTLVMEDKFFIIENVPARVCLETGERFFSPETVERLQETIWGQKEPIRMVETPVFEFAE